MSLTSGTETFHPLGWATRVVTCRSSYSSVTTNSTELMQGFKFKTSHLILDFGSSVLGEPWLLKIMWNIWSQGMLKWRGWLLSRVQGNQRMKYKNMYFSVNVWKYLAIFFNSHIIMLFDETIFSSKLQGLGMSRIKATEEQQWQLNMGQVDLPGVSITCKNLLITCTLILITDTLKLRFIILVSLVLLLFLCVLWV